MLLVNPGKCNKMNDYEITCCAMFQTFMINFMQSFPAVTYTDALAFSVCIPILPTDILTCYQRI